MEEYEVECSVMSLTQSTEVRTVLADSEASAKQKALNVENETEVTNIDIVDCIELKVIDTVVLSIKKK